MFFIMRNALKTYRFRISRIFRISKNHGILFY